MRSELSELQETLAAAGVLFAVQMPRGHLLKPDDLVNLPYGQLRALGEKVTGLRARLEQAERERDEAREAIREANSKWEENERNFYLKNDALERERTVAVGLLCEWSQLGPENIVMDDGEPALCFDNESCGCTRCRTHRWLGTLPDVKKQTCAALVALEGSEA